MYSAVSIPVLATVAVTCLLFYKYIVYPALLSPLAKIPSAHPLASVSPLWMLWIRYRFKENKTIYAAHERLGPIVRLGPNEVSVNCVEGGIRDIYAGGFEKHEFYSNQFANYDGVHVMFSMTHSKPHSVRKRMVSNIYSKSVLQSSPTLLAISQVLIYERLLPRIQEAVSRGGEMEVLSLFNAVNMDFVTAYEFGLSNSTNFIQHPDVAAWWQELFLSRRTYMYWLQELPGLTDALTKIGIHIYPEWASRNSHDIQDWNLRMCDAASKPIASVAQDEEAHPENIPVVHRQLCTALANDAAKSTDPAAPKTLQEQRITAASETLDHLAAGQETSAITLTYLFWELSRHPTLQDDLRAEIRTLSPRISLPSSSPTNPVASPPLPAPKAIDALPLLNAILMETLRLHAAIPGPQPRLTPAGGALLGPPGTTSSFALPAGVRVSANPYSLHRVATVFPSPESFMPERWLSQQKQEEEVEEEEVDEGDEKEEERLREMRSYFWAFSSGGRMCVGSNFAMQQMKLIVAAIVENFRIRAVEGGDEGIEQLDAYVAQPVGGKLVLRLEDVE